MTQSTVLLGMSGGVDSSVAADLLVEQGYQVFGVTLQVWEHEDESVAVSKRWQERGCCKVGLAKFVAQRLGIPHETVDIQSNFQRDVIDDFVAGYLGGTTPNPCVRCNERVKLYTLYRLAKERGIDFVATGHYANIQEQQGTYSLHRSSNLQKDQSYFLYRIQPSWLSQILFPVGLMQKPDVWARAEKLGLPLEELKESQEICFVSQGDYRTFLRQETSEADKPGTFVDTQGKELGQHQGIAYYTPGQRKGLGVSFGKKLYVQKVVPETNTVVLGEDADLDTSVCVVSDLNLFDGTIRNQPTQAEVKVRYATAPSRARLEPQGENMVQVHFDNPQRALSPGQSAVFYQGTRVLGGGIIQR